MAAPSKPWEGAGFGPVGNCARQSSATFGPSGGLNSSGSVGQITINGPTYRRVHMPLDVVRGAPPIPARIGNVGQRQSFTPNAPYGTGFGMGSYGNGLGGYGLGGYGTSAYGGSAYGTGAYGTGAYGSYGSQMYGGGYGMNRRYPQQGMNSLESRFIQMAEENSRPAFDSIESLVRAFGSVSFMMESTFHAIYSSFRAILGVAENFGRLRSLFGQVFQTFAILRMFQWIYRKLLYYLGIRRENPSGEAVWQQATGQATVQATGQLDTKTPRTFWPVAMFLGLVCGGPFIVWRLLRSLNIAPPATDNTMDSRTWCNRNGPTILPIAKALYDFTAGQSNELTVKRNQRLWVAPQHLQLASSDWLLVTSNWKLTGLVPANYVQIVEHRNIQKAAQKQPEVVVKTPENIETSEPIPVIVLQEDLSSLNPVQDASSVYSTGLTTPVIPGDTANTQTRTLPQPAQATGRLDDLAKPGPAKINSQLEDNS